MLEKLLGLAKKVDGIGEFDEEYQTTTKAAAAIRALVKEVLVWRKRHGSESFNRFGYAEYDATNKLNDTMEV